MSRYCNICGNEIPDNERFCPVCGSEINGSTKKESTNESLNKSALRNMQHVPPGVSKPKKTNWYAYNWKRVFEEPWNAGAKHHLAWICLNLLGITVGVMLLLGSIFCYKYIVRNVKSAFFAERTEVRASNSERYSSASSGGMSEGPSGGTSSGDYDDAIDDLKEAADNVVDTIDYYAKVAFDSLEGTWADSNGTFTLTIDKYGVVKISDFSGTIGADVFTWSEVDDNTVRLKAYSDDYLISLVSIDMDYEVKGETLTVYLLGKSFDLKRQKGFSSDMIGY